MCLYRVEKKYIRNFRYNFYRIFNLQSLLSQKVYSAKKIFEDYDTTPEKRGTLRYEEFISSIKEIGFKLSTDGIYYTL